MGELLGAGLLLAMPSLKRRAMFGRRAILGALFCFAFIWLNIPMLELCAYVDIEMFTWTSHIVWYTLLTFLSMGYFALCFRLNPSELLWLSILVYCMQHIAYVLINELMFLGFAASLYDNFPIYVLFNVLGCLIVYAVFYALFVPTLRERDHLPLEDTVKMRVTYFVLLCVFVSAAFVNQTVARKVTEDGIYYLGVVSDLFNCVFVAVAQYGILRANKLYLEKAAFMRLYNNAQRQYESFKKSVDYINVKCHDLKHQLRRIEQEGRLDAEEVRELGEGISVYESFAKTGNKTLDMLIADKHIECLSLGIAFSYMAEADQLNKMDDSDVYAMFANILDNAIAHVKDIEDRQKRYIHLTVKPVGGMLHIHQENYLQGKLELSGGLPVTTKSDHIFHGFGMKSISMIAKKYGGSLRIAADGEAFKLDILL